jgi:hypothetical protein
MTAKERMVDRMLVCGTADLARSVHAAFDRLPEAIVAAIAQARIRIHPVAATETLLEASPWLRDFNDKHPFGAFALSRAGAFVIAERTLYTMPRAAAHQITHEVGHCFDLAISHEPYAYRSSVDAVFRRSFQREGGITVHGMPNPNEAFAEGFRSFFGVAGPALSRRPEVSPELLREMAPIFFSHFSEIVRKLQVEYDRHYEPAPRANVIQLFGPS